VRQRSAAVVLLWGRTTGVGGTERRMLEVVEYMRETGVEVNSLMPATSLPSELASLLVKAGSEITAIGSAPALRRALLASGPSILAFGLRASLSARIAGAFLRKGPRIFDARNGLEEGRRPFWWAVDRITQPRVEKFVVNSEAVSRMLISKGIRPSRIVHLPSALGAEWNHRPASTPRAKGRILMIGNARPEKNHAIGLRALAETSDDFECHVYTNDAGALRSEWTALGGDFPGRTVVFHEGVLIAPSEMAKARILLHPSRSESLPRVLLEAQSQGLIPVVTDVGDCRRIVEDDGYVVPPNDVRSLSNALTSALRRASLSDWAPKVRSARTVDEYARDLLEILR
jgi:glycosyltransferase involved in cell wall biosynthesis